MKQRYCILFSFLTILSLVGCGAKPSENLPDNSTQPVEESAANTGSSSESMSYHVDDVVDFGSYQWRVLDVQPDRVLLLTDEVIALDYINITPVFRETIDSVSAVYPELYNELTDYTDWTVLKDDDLFPEGDSFYHHWTQACESSENPDLLDKQIMRESVTWADCSLRSKLNSELSFSDEEASRILETVITDPMDPGKTTTDKVFLLTDEQVAHYFPNREDRAVKGADLSNDEIMAYLKDLHVTGSLSGTLAKLALDLPNGGDFYWWSLGTNSHGGLGNHVGSEEVMDSVAPAIAIAGVRPAIWISTK